MQMHCCPFRLHSVLSHHCSGLVAVRRVRTIEGMIEGRTMDHIRTQLNPKTVDLSPPGCLSSGNTLLRCRVQCSTSQGAGVWMHTQTGYETRAQTTTLRRSVSCLWVVLRVSLCSPLIRADQGPLCGSSGLENKGNKGRSTDLRFLGGSRREGEGFTRIRESNRRRVG